MTKQNSPPTVNEIPLFDAITSIFLAEVPTNDSGNGGGGQVLYYVYRNLSYCGNENNYLSPQCKISLFMVALIWKGKEVNFNYQKLILLIKHLFYFHTSTQVCLRI